MHHKHHQVILLSLQKFSKNPINHLESLGLVLEHLRKNHTLGRTGPSSLERAASRLSESKHERLVLVRSWLAPSSLKRTGQLHYPGRLSLKRRETRLSDANDERLTFPR